MQSLSFEEASEVFEFWSASNVTSDAIRIFREGNKSIGEEYYTGFGIPHRESICTTLISMLT
jgi:hypothetical protein